MDRLSHFVFEDHDDSVESVPAGWMDGDAGGLINDDEVVVFVHDPDWTGGDWGLVFMSAVGDLVAVADDCVGGGHFSVDGDLSCGDCGLVVLTGLVAEFCRKHFEEVAVAPAQFAKGEVGEEVWGDAAEGSIEEVLSAVGGLVFDGGGSRRRS